MTIHLLRKDWQARRSAIVFWIGLVALCLFVQLGPLGRGGDPNREYGYVLLLMLLPFVVLHVMLGIAGNTVGEDSPIRRERFIATRPVTARSLWVSKVLFLGLTLIAPVTLLTALSLAITSRDMRIVFLGTLQMTLLATALTVFTAGFISLCSTRKETLFAIVAVGLSFAVFGAVLVEIVPSGWFDDLFRIRPLESTAGLLVAGILLCLLASRRRVLRSRLSIRLATIGLCTLAGLFVAARLPSWPVAGTSPGPTEDLPRDAAGHQFRWGEPGVGVWNLGVRLTLDRPAELKPDEDIDWIWKRVRVDDRTYDNPYLYRFTLGSGWGHNDNYRDSLRAGVENRLDHAVTWVLMNSFDRSLESPAHANAVFPGLEPGSSDAASLEVDIRAMVFRWECVADLPLERGAKVSPGDSSWSVAMVSHPDELDFNTAIVLDHRSPTLWFSRDEAERPLPIHVGYRSDTFLLHDRVRQRVFVGLEAHAQSRGLLPTGYRENRVDLRIPHDRETRELLDESWPDLRLLVFRPRILKRLDRRWSPPRPVVPGNLPLPGFHDDDRHRDLSAGGFALQYQLLSKPGPKASDIGSFLDEVIALAGRCDSSIDEARDPWVRDLAGLVPDHLATFLDRFRRLDTNAFRARRMLLTVLEQGCLDEEAGEVAAALAADDGLLPLILSRGWTTEARAILLEQFDYGLRSRELLEALHRIGAFGDDERRSRLIAGFRRRPDMATYRILRETEGAGEELDAVIDGFVADYPRVFPSGVIESQRYAGIPLAHGRIEPVIELHRMAGSLLKDDRRERHEVEELLDERFEHPEITGAQRHDGESLINWFLEREPREFRFDPISRRFVRPNP